MKLKTLVKMIPYGTKINVEYEGSLVYKGMETIMGKYAFVILDHYDVKSISADNDVLKIIAVRPQERKTL